MIIYFFPFQMEENDAFLDAEVKYQKMKNKECYGVKASHKTPLSFLKPSDTLYIVAHGNTSVIGSGSATGPTLNPVALASLLIHKRLPKNWICPYISRHLLSLNPLLACCRRYSRGER